MVRARSDRPPVRRPRVVRATCAAITALVVLGAGLIQLTAAGAVIQSAALQQAAATTKPKAVDAAPAMFVHPGITFNRADLVWLKKHLTKEPWKSA